MSNLARHHETETWGQVQYLTPSAFSDEPLLRHITEDLIRRARWASAADGFLPTGDPSVQAAFTKHVHRTEDEHQCDDRCFDVPAKTLEEATMVAVAVLLPVRADSPIYDALLAEQRAALLARLAELLRVRRFDGFLADVAVALIEQARFYATPKTVDEQIRTALERKRDAHGRFTKKKP